MTYILPLAKASDRALAGGKAAGCAALLRAGLPVPRGFVVTAPAFDAFLRANGFDVLRRGLIDAFRTRPEDELQRTCADFQEAVRAGDLPNDVRRALLPAYAALRDPVAVRSSATVEDSAAGAFAGVFHTELDVRADRIVAAVVECWAGAFAYAALTHAMRAGVDPASIRLALVVQEMVAAERAGVLFTREPSGADAAVIAVTHGNGAPLMQGWGGETRRVPRTSPDPLVHAGMRLERRLGHPQDIEWAERRGRLWFLQTRPITTIESGPPVRWTRALSEERFPGPISPLGWSTLETVLPVNLVTLRKRFGLVARRPEEVARTIDHHVYSNERFFAIPGSMRVNPLRQARFAHHYLKAALDVLLGAPALPRFCAAFIFPHAREVRAAWDAGLARHLRDMDAFDAVDPAALEADGLWAHHAAMIEAARRYMEPDLAIYAIKMACSWMISRLGGNVAALTAGLDNRTLRMSADFAELYAALGTPLEAGRFDEALDAPELRAFIARNGHVTTNWDLMEPTWGEDPRRILQMCLATRGRSRPAPREAAVRAGGPLFEEALATLREFMRIDEEHHFYCSRLFRPMRRLYLEIGARLAADGAIARADDVWFLTVPELETAPFTRRYVVERRRASFRRALGARPPDRFVGRMPVVRPAGDGLRGEGASPGVATGVVRVVESTADAAAFRPGEILVTTSPNPAWTPMYAVAGGLVTATGSTLSHGLVSAREYRLPAVTGIADVTKKLLTGQKITLDGHHGTVCIE